METNTLNRPSETLWPTVDRWMVNLIVDKSTAPLVELQPTYFRTRGSDQASLTAVQVIDKLISQREKVTFGSRKKKASRIVNLTCRQCSPPRHQPGLPLVFVTECRDVVEGWFRCEGEAEDTIQAFFQQAVKMGADPSLWEKHRKVLVPGGAGIKRHEATVKYFDLEGNRE
jgi:hypothetical protein